MYISQKREILVQAALPDLNTAWIMDKREFLNALRQKNYSVVYWSLSSINAAMPEKYRVEISDQKYNAELKKDLLVKCTHCDIELNQKLITIKSKLKPSTLALLTENKLEKVWECSNCHNDNILSRTPMIQLKPQEPFFLKVIPSPPSRKGSLIDKIDFHRKFTAWAYLFYTEISHQMSKLRTEYKPKGEEEQELSSIDGGESGDI